jgi:hypothetical protein
VEFEYSFTDILYDSCGISTQYKWVRIEIATRLLYLPVHGVYGDCMISNQYFPPTGLVHRGGINAERLSL